MSEGVNQQSSPAPTRYADLNDVLQKLVVRVDEILGANRVGIYLGGSFALGDFDEHSDVDFMVVTRAEVDEAGVARLNAMHEELYSLPSPWAQHLEGSYAPWELFRGPPSGGDPPGEVRPADWVDPSNGRPLRTYPFLYLDNGATWLVRSTHDNQLVVRWVLRAKGIALAGPAPAELIDPIDPAELRADVLDTMRWWAGDIAARPHALKAYWYQAFAVLTYCRMLHTIDTAAVHSKLAGAEWARANLDARWRPLIDRAWVERSDHWANVYRSADPRDAALTLEFIEYALSEAERRPH